MKAAWFLFGLICWAAIIAVLSACNGTRALPPDVPPEANNPLGLPMRTGGGDLTAAFRSGALSATLAPAGPSIGLARILGWGAACRPTSGINPVPLIPSRLVQGSEVFPSLFPTVGVPYKCFWLSAADGHGESNKACWVLWDTQLITPALDQTRNGFPGCSLAVSTANAVYLGPEGGVQGVFSRRAGEGRVKFEWTWPAEALGRSLFIQTVWITPGQNTGGMLITQPVELWIGATQPN